jgi:signal transduction histidine kinase
VSLTTSATVSGDSERPQSERARSLVESSEAGVRELVALREIAQAFLKAPRPRDVYQFALDRVSPLVGATFACIYLLDGESELMRLQAVYNWPERYDRFLGEMRVRVGFGPSGQAASERRQIEVPDIFADPSLEDWQEVATELGFRALVALPLQTSEGVLGTVTFYFASSRHVTVEARGLLRVVADQLAATAEKARLIEDLQRANGELEKQYRAVVEARRLQDEFLSNVSHELRTPLTSVLGYLALIEEGLAGPVSDEQQRTLKEVKASSEKLLELIADLLDLTALKRDELNLQLSEFDPRGLLRDVLAAVPNKKESVELVFEAESEMPTMRSDRRKLARLLAVLVGNAFKFTEQGHVRVSVEARDDRMLFRIADTGVGISEAAQRFVFDEFRQEDGSSTRRYGGSGLGLAIARRLARMLGGDIALSSERGKGSTFEVEIPRRLA